MHFVDDLFAFCSVLACRRVYWGMCWNGQDIFHWVTLDVVDDAELAWQLHFDWPDF